MLHSGDKHSCVGDFHDYKDNYMQSSAQLERRYVDSLSILVLISLAQPLRGKENGCTSAVVHKSSGPVGRKTNRR